MIRALLTQSVIAAIERGLVPDALTRMGIRRLCGNRLRSLGDPREEMGAFIRSSEKLPIAILPEKANEQHYEVPAEFFGLMLGSHRKYSCCYWPADVRTLDEAEAAALEATCKRMELENGMSVLELGCGWGSLALWMAERYPGSQITTVSGSSSQRQWIEALASAKRLENLRVITCDMNDFQADAKFDRIVSIEMFEHMSNYRQLFQRISDWLSPDGNLFVHIFCHRTHVYRFEVRGAADWMSQYFFSGGVMPAKQLFQTMSLPLRVDESWEWSGLEYQKTAEAWLINLDRNRDEALRVLANVYGAKQASQWLHRWRIFLIAVSELFGYRGGVEWMVGHYRFKHVDVAKEKLVEPADCVS